MLSISALVLISFFYLVLLFAIAFVGDKYTISTKLKPVVFSLGLGVYCTSWAIYGVTGQFAQTGWWFTPTFTGAILVFIFAWPLVLKVARICREQSLTSLADFIASRYGKSSKLAGLITITAVFAIIPYIALQLRAITNSFNTVTNHSFALSRIDITLLFTLTLAVFAILFGTRRIRSSEHNPGLLLAIAFESIVKLVTFLAIGFFVCFVMFDGMSDLFTQAETNQAVQDISAPPSYVYLTQTLLGVLMMFCLPRQFHMTFIEHDNERELNAARWLFPLYMILLNVFALPIAYAGLILFDGSSIGSDSFMLQLPMLAGNYWMTAVSYLGGFSAATSMAIVATIVLSIMVSNDLVTPKLLVRESGLQQQQRLSPNTLLIIRRITIVVILLAAYAYHQVTSNAELLAMTGLMSMSLVAQFSPALLLGLIWRRANVKAAYRSILVGTSLWFYTLLLPSLNHNLVNIDALLEHGLLGISWLRPTMMFGLELEFISHGVIVSLVTSFVVFIYYSLIVQPDINEQLQAHSFIGKDSPGKETQHLASKLSIKELHHVLVRFFGQQFADQLLQQHFQQQSFDWHHTASVKLEQQAEQELAGVIGGASAKLLLDSAKRRRHAQLNEVVDIVDEASELLKFNRSLLQATIQNVEQGISVVDKELRVVAWNRRYIEMFDYPEAEIFVGRPVEEVLRFNAKRGFFPKHNSALEVAKRIAYLEEGKSYRYQRVQRNGKVYEMSGNPLPGGGFVTTYSDITEFVNTQKALEEINVHLESRVAQRTQDLQQLNIHLQAAKQEAEQANINKTRYFAALSHDLLQPFNAASLFSSILVEKTEEELVDSKEVNELSQNIHRSLSNAEQLLTSILELTKLDAGTTQPFVEDFYIDEFILPICQDYALIAKTKGLVFTQHIAQLGTRSDKALLRRVLQNLLSNAVRYTPKGEICVVAQQHESELLISVRDTGVGIAAVDQQRIFNDFEQIGHTTDEDHHVGLGLGLAITSRICKILGISLSVQSTEGQGSCFTISLPIINVTAKPSLAPSSSRQKSRLDLAKLNVLVIDNDQSVLLAMVKRLAEWGCKAQSAMDEEIALDCCKKQQPDIIIADYHLDAGKTGVQAVQFVNQQLGLCIPVIINSADHSDEIHEQVVENGYVFIHKPVKPAALKRAIKKLIV
ncbi:PAS domain-containing hybrid sensor histidine kinase/response regulator [Thalassotalea sp. G2M2-11]|uniref:hybrid sensor histidine kinase/response regulator n=1 Tax=Thalassotalea sp. G2M2-11 TaxID=2787627 RepID=UPI0019CF84B1|nr:PAS domain-containing hybrid sensor histidine kinase/response regulator [Thalassotalea sp. G2M2-11]